MKTKIIKNNQIKVFKIAESVLCEIPLLLTKIQAGFPSPAEDYMEERLSLDKKLIKNRSATFFARVTGDSMINSGIYNGDLIIVDKALNPKPDSVLLCVLDGEFTLKKVRKIKNKMYMIPENPDYPPIKISEYNDFRIWGVVTYSIRTHY
ncbi:MAG: translesion error-prone DNA polymerase V autoproteolytic subunit [Chlorobi bacterium]|nr:translesion error-prone DNA polymerase V autoproteolytic subunit [Chlorobiota bacterium]